MDDHMKIDVEFPTYTSDEIIQHIRKLCNEYQKKNHSRPHYLKIPKYMFIALQTLVTSEWHDDFGNLGNYICGLKACPTDSICALEEIEVF